MMLGDVSKFFDRAFRSPFNLYRVEPLREIYRRRNPDSEAVWYRLPENKEEEEQFQQTLSDK
jgi:hypothetical protein